MTAFGLAVWAHGLKDFGDPERMKEHVGRLADAGVDILIPCVKNPPGAVDFATDLADIADGYAEWDPLRSLIECCREKGIKVHPWMCVFPEGERSKLLREHPEYEAVFDPPSNRRWACACREEVQEYEHSLYRDLAERYGPDGLHLDYIRTGGLCRCEHCAREMARRGVDIAAVEARDPAFEAWTEWRVSRVTGFVRRLRAFTDEKGMELSAAVFAGYPDSIRSQGQDWVQWSDDGLLDYLFPMNYTNSLAVARARTICHVALVSGRTPIWEGLGKRSSASQLGPEELAAQAREVLAAGAKGIVLFSYPALTDEDLSALSEIGV